MSQLGINIKRIRESKKITISKLSKAANVGMATISQIESGVRQSLNSDTISKIARVLNVNADQLFSNEETILKTDIKDMLDDVLNSNLLLDNIELDSGEKNLIFKNIESTLKAIKDIRDARSNLDKNIISNIKDFEDKND